MLTFSSSSYLLGCISERRQWWWMHEAWISLSLLSLSPKNNDIVLQKMYGLPLDGSCCLGPWAIWCLITPSMMLEGPALFLKYPKKLDNIHDAKGEPQGSQQWATGRKGLDVQVNVVCDSRKAKQTLVQDISDDKAIREHCLGSEEFHLHGEIT